MEYSMGNRFVEEIGKSVVGREAIVELMVVSLLSQGHVLLEGNPGLGKTTLAKSFSQTIGGEFKRIQMTPDTLPADILGTYIFDQRNGSFYLRKGPIFANVILVDELNRATPKAQSALLESMQERQVSIEGETMKLNEPFMVIATQVAFGAAGTYPLSEVQSDRFAFSVEMGYPSAADEGAILSRIDAIESGRCAQLFTPEDIMSKIQAVKEVFVSEAIRTYIVGIANTFRQSQYLKNPPSPRASIALLKGCRALAFLEGRDHVIPDDVKFLTPYVVPHRMFLRPEAISEDITKEQIIKEVLDTVPVPKE